MERPVQVKLNGAWLLLVLGWLLLLLAIPWQAAIAGTESGSAHGTGSQVRLISVTSGSKGSERGGKFEVEDPRSTFTIPDDTQVIVYFEWDGSLGPHHLQAVWKNPDGKAVVLTDLNYTATKRPFGAYFALKLDVNVAAGVWTVEAKVDGQEAGSTSFQVNSDLKPASAEAAPNPLSAGAIYKLAVASTVVIEKLDSQGRRFGRGSAFFIADDLLATSFGVVDGASSLRVLPLNAPPVAVIGVVSWNRREDWAVLRIPQQQAPVLKLAGAGPAQVGDTCYSLDVAQDVNRTITDGVITGDAHLPGLGELLNLSLTVQRSANGSPVLNERGEVIGIAVSGVLLPGAAATDTESAISLTALNDVVRTGPDPFRGSVAVPATLLRLPTPGAATTTLQSLAAAGQMTPILRGGHSVWRGFIAQAIQPNGEMPLPIGEKYRFSRQDQRAEVMVEWDAIKSLKFDASMELYDLDNRRIAVGKSVKISAPSGHKATAAWTLRIAQMAPGIYRVDVLADSDVVWRTFFRVED